MKNYIVLQDGMKECGSACLLSIIKYYGGNISIERLLELTNTTKEGTTFFELGKAANEIGLISKGYKVEEFEKLTKIEKPFISQVVIDNYTHFVVVYKIKSNKITIMDPAKGMINISIEHFKSIYTGYILLLEPYKKLPTYNEDNFLLNIIKTTITNNKKIIINLILLTLITTIFTCIYSYHFKIVIDKIITTNKLNVIVVTVIFIIIMSIKVLIEFLRNNLLLYLNQKIDLSIITTTINKIITLPYNYYKNKTTGEMISRVNDLLYIKNVISKIIITLFLDLLLAVITIVILFSINKIMTILLLVIIIIYILIFFAYKNSIKNLTNTIQENNAKVNSLLVESISSYETIKGLNLENIFKKKINKEYLYMINDNLTLTKLSNTEELLKDLGEGIMLLLIICIGTISIMDKSLSIGSLITYNTLLFYFINPIRASFDFYQDYFYVKNSLKRINNILNFKYEKLDETTDLTIDGNIKFQNVEFSYNSRKKVLDKISFICREKSKNLILGSSGTGKSTLLKILYKYYEIPRNMVYLGNYDINDFKLQDIRKNITYISQNEILYTDTIRNNIILGREVSEKEFLNVCKLTYIDEIIKDNLLSYDYVLEENGSNISGGQRQRIILARALLKTSKIILIDEGLNEIDINLERKILKNIFDYYHQKTFIIISHRLDNMELYDQVINITNGKIKDVLTRNE